MNFSELKGRAVIDITSAKTIGHLEDLVVDLEKRQITGFRVKESGLFGHINTLPVAVLQGVGNDALTVQLDGEPAKEKELENEVGLSSLLNRQVISQGGKMIGQISDIALAPAKLTITGYEVKESGFMGKKHTLPETSELNFSSEMVIIPDSLAAHLGNA
jgi:sporulation protein YlmC with PRC-barrel domain